MPPVIYMTSRLVEAYGSPAGCLVINRASWHAAYNLDWSPVGQFSTEERAARALEMRLLQALYPPTVEVLLEELERGLVCLDQDPANLNRLERCDESQIREISAALLDRRWSKQHVAELVARWRKLKEGE